MSPSPILVVENNASTRKMMRLALLAEGYSVLEAEDGAAALRVVAEHAVSLVLLDCKLPDMDGFEIARRLRAMVPELAMLAITGWAHDDESRMATAGFLEVLVKPVEPSRLTAIVARHLAGRTASGAAVGAGRLVVLADDDPAHRKLGELALTHAGFEVLVAEDGEAALELARRRKPEAIVSDVLMRRMDGFAMCNAVRDDPSLTRVPVILLSSHYLEEEDRILAAKCGATRYLSRAEGPDALVRALDSALESSATEPVARHPDELQALHLRRVAHQLERQASIGAGLERRMSLQSTALSVLDGLSESLSKQLDPERALGETLAGCLDAAGLSVGAILLLGADGRLTAKADVGTPVELDWGAHAALLLRAMRRGGSLLPSESAAREGDALLAALGVASALVVPVVARDEALGVLLLASNRTDLAGEEGEAFVRAARSVSAQIGQALALGRMFSELAHAEQRYRAIFENARDAIVITTPDGVIVDANRGSEAVMGVPRGRLVGRNVADFSPDETAPRRSQYERALAQAGGSAPPAPVKRPDGTVLQVEVSRAVIDVGDDKLVLSVGRDVTERLRMEEQLRQVQKMDAVGNLAAGVAHDFNNLLSVILSYSTLVLGELKPGDPLRVDIEEVKRAGERSCELTRQLLAFSRKQMLQPRFIDLNSILAGMERMLRRLLGESVDLSLLTFGRVGKVLADPGQIEQVIMNLVVNARDAMPAGGKLSVETADVELDADYAARHHGLSAGPYVMLAVSDTGTGMDAGTRDRIFEPFFTTKELGTGTGLGLATVFGIVKQSDGHVWVYSEPGKGTTFKVYLPRQDHAVEESVPVPPSVTDLRGHETVLLVEDEEQVRTLARAILGRNGYNVLEAQNGGEAFLVCEQYEARIHLLLTDVIMPRMSGKQLAERLAPLRPDMRVLFMSGYTDNSVVHHGVLDAGVAFLQKPITPDGLLRKIREVLDTPAREAH